MTRRTRSTECTKGCGGRTRHRSGVCPRCRVEVVRVREIVEYRTNLGVICLSPTLAIELSNALIDAVESDSQCGS